MKWGRFGVFLVIVLAILGLTAGTSMKLWKSIPLGLDLQGGIDVLYQIQPGQGDKLTTQGVNALVQAVEMRINNLGVSSPTISIENGNQIRVDIAGQFNQAKAINTIGQTTQLLIYGSEMGKHGYQPNFKALLAKGSDLKPNASWQVEQSTGQNVVAIEFKNANQWSNITKKYLMKPIYIFLNGQLITDPVIQQVMSTGQSEINGPSLSTPKECQQLANQLNAGALPYPLKLMSSTNVGPSLGAASLHATLYAGAIAVILIFLFMIFMYRLAGLIADFALIAYGYITLAVFAGMHVVLTLPGLAALVLGIGMAVDANIISYERIKDEFRNGKSLQSSVIAGNKRALRTILDSNATTFIAGAVMYWFGTGDIRGFAIALMISIIVSLLTAVFLSRTMLMSFTKANVTRRAWLYGIRKGVVER